MAPLPVTPAWRNWHQHGARDTEHKVGYYLQRRDPAFEERKAEVLEVYAAAEMLRIPETDRPVAVLSYDEKPGIQAIATTAPDLPPKPGKHATVQRDHDYKRLGTLTLSAAVDLVSGFVHHVVTERHRSREFVALLERLDAYYRPSDRFLRNRHVPTDHGNVIPAGKVASRAWVRGRHANRGRRRWPDNR
jgi:hypothetical protein